MCKIDRVECACILSDWLMKALLPWLQTCYSRPQDSPPLPDIMTAHTHTSRMSPSRLFWSENIEYRSLIQKYQIQQSDTKTHM